MKKNMITKCAAIVACAMMGSQMVSAQGLQAVQVETYYVSNPNDAANTEGGLLPAGSVTYRVYIDMAPGYKLLSMYGSPTHELFFETTTLFFNNEDRGAVAPNNINTNNIGDNTVMLDSWLGVGAGSSTLWAVPKQEDNNGAIANNDGILQNNNALAGFPISVRDGLIPGPTAPPVVTFVPGSSTFGTFDDITAGPVFSTSNAAWAALGGATGPTAANRVCVAQITTNGVFSFELNVQILAPSGDDERYVAKNALAGEVVFPGLTFSTAPTCNVNGGTIASSSPRQNLCIGDGFADVVSATVSGNIGQGRFGLVRQSTGQVVSTNATGSFNMETFPAGNYYIAHVSVNNLAELAGITNVSQLSGCFNQSNLLQISTIQLTGGTISANGSTTICTGTLGFSSTGSQGPNFVWALLNSNGTQVLAQNTTGVFNFTTRPAGTYRVTRGSYGPNVNLGAITPPQLPPCFVTSNTIVVNKVNCGVSLESSPNPTTGFSNATFSVDKEGTATLEVYDMSGRKIAELFNQVVSSDVEYRVEFDGNALPNGVYIYRLTTINETVIDKFMIAR